MAAIGHAEPNPLPVHGALWFDARQFGMSPHNPDNSAALQAAHDAAVAALATYGGGQTPLATIFIPAAKGAYNFKNPVFVDGSSVRFLGEGRGNGQGTTLTTASGYSYPLFVLGFPRSPSITSASRPDLWNGGSPKLDSTFVSGAARRWGFRTNGNSAGWSHGSPLALGGQGTPDYWQGSPYLTIDVAVEGFSAGAMPTADVLVCNYTAVPTPYSLVCNGGGSYTFHVGTQAAKFGPVTVSSYTFSTGSATGVVKLTLQVDLKARTVTAWVNGTQVAVTGAALPAGVNFAEPGTAHGDNVGMFQINGDAGNLGSADFAVYGLCISQARRYAVGGVGSSQIPNPQFLNNALFVCGNPTGGTYTITVNGQTTAGIPAQATAAQIQSALAALPGIGAGNVSVTGSYGTLGSGGPYTITGLNGVAITGTPGACDGSNLTGSALVDAFRYSWSNNPASYNDPYVVCYLLGTDGASPTRNMAFYTPTNNSYHSLLLIGSATYGGAITGNVRFEGLGIQGGTYGTGVFLGHVLDIHFDLCSISGGTWAIADLYFGANYPIYLDDCSLSGADAALAMYYSDVQMDNINFATNGRWTLRLTGCDANLRHSFTGTTSSPQYGFCRICNQIYGGTYIFDDIAIDNEGVNYGLTCFYAERHPYSTVNLTVNNAYLGLPGTCDLFQLKDMGGLGSPYGGATLTANFVGAELFGSLVNVDGPSWQFAVTNTAVDGGSDVTSLATYPGRPVGRVERISKLPARYGQSVAGCSRVRNPGPSDGQFIELVPATDGTWGSSAPARWVGTGVLQSDPSVTLAAYMQDHTSYGATLSGQASAFGYSTNVVTSPTMAKTLFGSTIAGTSTVLALYGKGLGGTFTLSYGGQTTAALAYNASAATIQSALQGLSSVGSGNMTVGGAAGGPWTISLAGSLARQAGGILGLTVNGAGLTATGGQAMLTGGVVVGLYGTGLGGTFTITYNGLTTAPIPYNASAATVASALQILNYQWAPNVGITGAPGGPYQSNQGFQSVNDAGLTATGGQAVLTPVGMPSTWYVGLLTTGARKRNYPINELLTSGYPGVFTPPVPATGYVRQVIPNSTSGFTAASSGTKSNVAAITFPAATNAYTVSGIALFDAPLGGNIWATIQLAQPITVAAGSSLTIPAGALTIANVPSLGSFGSFTNYGWGKLYDLLFSGSAFAVPTTWYAALSTAALNKLSAGPAEPSGNGYARAAVSNDTAHWTPGVIYGTTGQAGDTANNVAVSFPTPSGSWGTLVAAALADAGTGGNTWVVAPLTAPVTPSTAAPTFAVGSLLLGLG